MLKFLNKYILFSLFIIFHHLSVAQSVSASELKFSPFALYEQGQENIYIDGVRTKYGLGVLGISVDTKLGGKFKLRTRLGYGYHPSARVSLTVEERQVAVTGPVSGFYIEGEAKYTFLDKPSYALTSELRYIIRNVDAPDLEGFAGSRAITGTAVNDFDTLDLTLSAKLPVGQVAFVSLAAGLSEWHLKTTAVARSETGGSGSILCPCTYTKRINTFSKDPIFRILITSNNPQHNFDLEFYNRSLNSKAGTHIVGAELEYIFQF